MKQGRFYLAAAILLLASGCEKEDGENTDDSKWTHPLTTTLHRTDPGGEQSTYVITYTYDAKDRLTGTQNSRDGVTETTTSDYVYDGKTVTYTEKTWAGETLWNSQKFKRTYLDDALEKVLEERITDKDDHIIQRICNEYDQQERLVHSLEYSRGNSKVSETKYTYDGKLVICDKYWLKNTGEVSAVSKYIITYSDDELTKPLIHGCLASEETAERPWDWVRHYSYDYRGRLNGITYEAEGKLVWETRNYVYGNKSLTCENREVHYGTDIITISETTYKH